MTTAGDIAALLGGARERVRTARAAISDWTDPHAALRAWSTAGPWQAAAAAGDPEALGLRSEPGAVDSRQWLDLAGDRAREERAGLVLVRDGARWWRDVPGMGPASGEEPESSLEVAATLRIWTDPQPLARALELERQGEKDGALRVRAVARSDSFDGALTQLGWGAAWWELLVDPERGVLLGTTAFNAADEPFRRVTASGLAIDEDFEDSLFTPA